MWKKENELKLLKSDLATLDRKIQLKLTPPVPKVAEKETDDYKQESAESKENLTQYGTMFGLVETKIYQEQASIKFRTYNLNKIGVCIFNDYQL